MSITKSLDELLIAPESTLATLFLHSSERFPARPALWVNSSYYSYIELYSMASSIACLLQDKLAERCAIYAGRNETAYAAVLACLLVNKTYVPLNPKTPLARNLTMFALADTDVVIVDKSSVNAAKIFLAATEKPLWVILHGYYAVPAWAIDIKQHRYLCAAFFTTGSQSLVIPTKYINEHAYLLFTSGSTGMPKAVAASHRNVLAYITAIIERYQPCEKDRFSQLTELTFDFSVHDMFVCWSVGACLYSLPENYFIGLAKFVYEHKLTFWASVPSTVAMLKQLRKLKPKLFNSLRCSIFCGEALPNSLAEIWHATAPHSIIDNLYGPTEATVACTAYRWASAVETGVVPIGEPFPQQAVAIVDVTLRPLPAGEVGELCLAGPQVVPGYWRNLQLTQERFIKLAEDDSQLWYRTGDLALCDTDNVLHYKGRCDDEIKIRGYRVEKSEIETAIRNTAGTELVAVIFSRAMGLIAFVSSSAMKGSDILKICRKQLPDYMVPAEIIDIAELPFNQNGKIDYKKLKELKQGMEQQVLCQ